MNLLNSECLFETAVIAAGNFNDAAVGHSESELHGEARYDLFSMTAVDDHGIADADEYGWIKRFQQLLERLR